MERLEQLPVALIDRAIIEALPAEPTQVLEPPFLFPAGPAVRAAFGHRGTSDRRVVLHVPVYPAHFAALRLGRFLHFAASS